MFKEYDLKIKEILSRNSPDTDWKYFLENHQEMIPKIQHERLVHLLVMIFTGTIMALSFFFTILTGKIILLLLDVPLLGLFLGYVFHYRYLENTTQNWYKLEEEIKKRLLEQK